MKTVLSIDGGGIRGLIPALVLADLESRTERPVADLFDLIAGTSTGGILALGLTIPDGSSGEGAPQSLSRYSARELADLYRTRGPDIFDRSIFRRLTSVGRVADEKYPSDGLKTVLGDYFGDVPLGEVRTDTIISSYDLQNREPFFFKSWQEPDDAVLARRAARATSAAPTFFEPARVQVGDGTRTLIDGGVYVNNPAVSAYAEARRRFPENEELRVVAIGTGSAEEPIPYEEAKGWGLLEWGVRIYPVAADGVDDAADYQMEQILGDRFTRFQVSLRKASDDMDDASKENLNALEADAETLLRKHEEAISRLANILQPERASET